MKNFRWIVLVVFLSSFSVFSQKKYVKHAVEKGETISKIAKQYHVKSNEIYELNPDARNGIKFRSVLLIPTDSSSKTNATFSSVTTSTLSEHTHEVLPKETLYGIAKQYGLTVKDLYISNPELEKSGLKIGDKIKVVGGNLKTDTPAIIASTPSKEEVAVVPPTNLKPEILTESIVREVLPKETLYGIAKQYGLSVSELETVNPGISSQGLRIGQSITIPVAKELMSTKETVVTEVKNEKENTTADILVLTESTTTATTEPIAENKVAETEVSHEVLAKETKYGIAKTYGITVKELEAQNPKIVNQLPMGYKLTIRITKPIVTEAPQSEVAEAKTSEWASNYSIGSFHSDDFVDQLVTTASENIGTRYRIGGTSKDGFDCSGLMYSTFGAFDIQLPRTSLEQSRFGVQVNPEDAKKGDLIFFKTNGRHQINHVGMVVEVSNDGDIKFIHASVHGGVIISSIKEKYYIKKVTQINRVL